MSSPREGINPLRPYYIPPTIGESALPPEPSSYGLPESTSSAAAAARNNGHQYASKARDILNDLDYNDYISEESSGALQTVKGLIDDLLWKYTAVLMSQPFEVAKIVLQVRAATTSGLEAMVSASDLKSPAPSRKQESVYDYNESDDSDADENSYFTSNAPSNSRGGRNQPQRRTSSPHSRSSRSQQYQQQPDSQNGRADHGPHLQIRRPDSVMDAIGQLWQSEGAFGVWKGANATFLYTVLQSLIENWSRSLMSAVFNVPDLGVVDEIDRIIDIAAPYPWASFFVAASAAVATGLILAPLDLIRTRLLLTPNSCGPRRTLTLLRALPSYICPPALVVPTALHSLVHPLLNLSTPLILRTQFMIDSQASPTAFSIVKFLASSTAIFIKLPLETVLRRGQAATLIAQSKPPPTPPALLRRASSRDYRDSPRLQQQRQAAQEAEENANKNKIETIGPLGRYDGIFGTMYHIMFEEGTRVAPKTSGVQLRANRVAAAKGKVAETVYLQGQGVDGLWRGWKTSWWGLVGLWASSVIGGGGEGEF